jgi:hypothetical protein
VTGGLLLAPQAEGLLAEVVDYAAANARKLPERRVIIPGLPSAVAWDCQQVTVGLANLTTATASGQSMSMPQIGPAAGVGLIRYATWSVQVVRCTPQMDEAGNPPSAEELAVAGLLCLDDAGWLSQCFSLLAASGNDGSRGWLPPGGTINAGAVTTLGPEGPYFATEAAVTMTAMEAD